MQQVWLVEPILIGLQQAVRRAMMRFMKWSSIRKEISLFVVQCTNHLSSEQFKFSQKVKETF